MAAPDYSMLDSMGAGADSPEEEATEGTKLSANQKMLAEKIGMTEEQAEALKDFVAECMGSDDYSDTGATDTGA